MTQCVHYKRAEIMAIHHMFALLVAFEYFVFLQNLEMSHGVSHSFEIKNFFFLNLRGKEEERALAYWVTP